MQCGTRLLTPAKFCPECGLGKGVVPANLSGGAGSAAPAQPHAAPVKTKRPAAKSTKAPSEKELKMMKLGNPANSELVEHLLAYANEKAADADGKERGKQFSIRRACKSVIGCEQKIKRGF